MGINSLKGRVVLVKAIGKLRTLAIQGGVEEVPALGEPWEPPTHDESVLVYATIDLTQPLGILLDASLVAIEVNERSQSFTLGVCAGWRICSVAGEPLCTLDALEKKMEEMVSEGLTASSVAFLPSAGH